MPVTSFEWAKINAHVPFMMSGRVKYTSCPWLVWVIIISEVHCRLHYFSYVAIFVVVVSYFIDFCIRIPPAISNAHTHTNTQTQRTLLSELAMQFCEAFGTYIINSFYDISPSEKAFFFHESWSSSTFLFYASLSGDSQRKISRKSYTVARPPKATSPYGKPPSKFQVLYIYLFKG